MDQPSVVCLLPVYNAELFLKEAIESVLNQSYENFRLLIINDGSTDYSESIIDSFKDHRIKKVNNPLNSGLIYTLNRGLELCNEKYIIRMDADDICEKERFQKQIDYMESHPNVWVCGAQVTYFGKFNGVSEFPINTDEISAQLFFKNAIAHPSVILRNEKFKEYDLNFEKEFLHAEDYRLWTKVSEKGGELHNLRESLLKYRVEGQNISLKNFDSSFDKIKLIWRDFFAENGFPLQEEGLILHGVLCGRLNFNQECINDLFNYCSKLEEWQKHNDSFLKFYNKQLDELFFRICDKNPKLIKQYWKFRKKIKLSEFRYWFRKK